MNPKLKLAGAALGGVVVTLVVGCIASVSMDKGLGPFRGIDADNDGLITRAEWLQTAGTRFDALDANKDGKLVVGEIPAAPRRGPGGHRHGHGGPDDWGRGAPPPEAQPAPAAPAPAAPAPAPAAAPVSNTN
ncbi:hypothetical protein P1X14_02655 [Sphingomonas sp. AOB5]|uniref:hypothetical protein n=1 Tax=Sphingomonas sp. AOB5 TaxID=3034017 RepID=UPI0023F66471|nr:hypothetical protein [Sphingomonas sp. AOB5]MDF7774136.1 hypothetical protein [Sphingomonas sp. AOB5]